MTTPARPTPLRIVIVTGLSGGGNELRQPYLRRQFGDLFGNFPVTDHVHFYGCYIGNYPTLDRDKIHKVCSILNVL